MGTTLEQIRSWESFKQSVIEVSKAIQAIPSIMPGDANNDTESQEYLQFCDDWSKIKNLEFKLKDEVDNFYVKYFGLF